MEKKGNRNLPNSSRGSGTDLKKNQDASTGKSWPRATSRRREPPCGFSKAEPSRKPQPQRIKTCDKRPKPRGFYYTSPTPRNEAACLDDLEEPELASVFSPGSKKQSLNHLLNFSYAPREGHQLERAPTKSGGKLLMTRKHKYNKEHFLQANCQFIVNEKGDYRQYMNNPDALVDWNLIEQVNVQVSETPSCPICLYPPLAAKMTKCGHVYCWSCILHYLALSDKQCRKCPICFDAVKKDDLKSVIAISHPSFNVNKIITFKLMKRQRGSITAYPVDTKIEPDNSVFNMSDLESDNCYSKLLLANAENILGIIERESTELEIQMAQDENCPEKCFIEEAVELLIKRREKILEENVEKEVKNNVRNVKGSSDDLLHGLKDLNLSNEDGVSQICNAGFEEKCVNGDEKKSGLSNSDGGQALKLYYFYQAADGQHIYLHAINARMLERTYGSLEFGPKILSGKILEKEGGSMTEDLRKRLRYLQHLPVTCQFEVAEILLHEPLVNRDTLDHFKEQIDIRKKRRQRRARDEKRREKRIEAEENRKIGKYASPVLHLESRDQFPDVSEAHLMFPEFGSESRPRTESESTLLSQSECSCSPDLTSVSNMSLESGYAGPSFATMLATEKKPTKPWPSLKPTASAAPPVKLINVTGTKIKGAIIARRHADSDHELEDYEPVPDFNRSFGDALAQALARSEEDNAEHGSVVLGKNKKKKTKQKVLFSTHMACSGK